MFTSSRSASAFETDEAALLVAAAQRDARTKDDVYKRRQRPPRRAWHSWALAASLLVLVIATAWSVGREPTPALPPPAVEALDLARTLRLAIAEVEDFRTRYGALPDAALAAALLPEGARLVAKGESGGYEIVVPAPALGELRYASDQDPDLWLTDVGRVLGRGGDS